MTKKITIKDLKKEINSWHEDFDNWVVSINDNFDFDTDDFQIRALSPFSERYDDGDDDE